MKKFTTTAEPMKAEPMPAERETPKNVSMVDTSVRLGPLGEMKRGAVDINSPAYTGKFKG